MNKDCIYFTRFEPKVNLGGGCRRLAQLNQVLSIFDFELISSRTTAIVPETSTFIKGFNSLKYRVGMLNNLGKHYITNGEYNSWHPEYRDIVLYYRQIARQWADLIKDLNFKLVFVDDPIYFSPLIKRLKKNNIPIIAISHNLETLSSEQVVQKKQRLLFNLELDTLSYCDLVITISREENFLLNNLSIKSINFPYYPADEILKRMLNVRIRRLDSTKRDVILIGTASNKPTKQGMIRVINAWKEYKLYKSGNNLIVAGFGTDTLKDIAIGKGIVFLGELSNEEVDQWLSTVRASLCYQEAGSGALTRIPEMLIAGVPVIANSHAARSYYNYRGLIELSCLEHIGDAINVINDLEKDDIPVPSPPDSSHMLALIRRIANEHKNRGSLAI